MTNSIPDIYILKAFESLVYQDMKKLLNEFMRLSINYTKTDDEMEKIALHDVERAEMLKAELVSESENIEEIKNDIKKYLSEINDREVFEELIKIINEEYTTHAEKVILKSLEDIIKEKIVGYEKISELQNDIQFHTIEILDEGIDLFENNDIVSSCHIGLTNNHNHENKRTVLKQIFQLLKQYNTLEFKHFLENIKKTNDIDFELEPGLNLYAFAITNGFDDIVQLIQKYKNHS